MSRHRPHQGQRSESHRATRPQAVRLGAGAQRVRIRTALRSTGLVVHVTSRGESGPFPVGSSSLHLVCTIEPPGKLYERAKCPVHSSQVNSASSAGRWVGRAMGIRLFPGDFNVQQGWSPPTRGSGRVPVGVGWRKGLDKEVPLTLGVAPRTGATVCARGTGPKAPESRLTSSGVARHPAAVVQKRQLPLPRPRLRLSGRGRGCWDPRTPQQPSPLL